jgi:hypothetical protein
VSTSAADPSQFPNILLQTHLVAKRIHRHAKRPGQPEIPDLELSTLVDQQVLRFEISMQDPVVVAERDALSNESRTTFI